MKYIDAEKLIAEIERRRLSNRYIDTEGYENELLEIITSLQQEQPSNLKEAAEHSGITTYSMPEDGDIEKVMEVQKARIFHGIGFKAGAEWQRESLSHTMLTYAADVFSSKMLVEDISYSYRQELADYFRDLTKTAQEE